VAGIDANGNSAVTHGQKLYYTTGDTPKINKKATGIPFGIAWSTTAGVQTGNLVAAGATTTIRVLLIPANGIISLADEEVTLAKMADLARGSIIVGATAGNRPTALDAKGDGKILVGDSTDLKSVSVTGDVTITNAGVTAIGAGKVLPSMLGYANVAVTANDDGLTTAIIPETARFVTVTSAGATKAVSLPSGAAANIGKVIHIYVGANGFELLSEAGSNATINGADADGTNQADIPATSVSRLTLVAANTWIMETIGANGTVAAAIVPDND
jgi:hypothetical protein